MNKRKSRFFSLLLACVLALTAAVMPAAATGSSAASTDRADKLADLGLFRGTEQGYELDSVPSRIQGLVMLIWHADTYHVTKAIEYDLLFWEFEQTQSGLLVPV